MSEKQDAYWLELVELLPLRGISKQIMYHVTPMPTTDENVFALGFEPNGLVATSLASKLNKQIVDDISNAFKEIIDNKIRIVFMPIEMCKNRTAAQLLESKGQFH
jgi:hypothetical protein